MYYFSDSKILLGVVMKSMSGNVMLLLAPNENAYQQLSNIPPLALGVLKGYLSENEINTEIYDLNQTLHNRMNELTMKRCQNR